MARTLRKRITKPATRTPGKTRTFLEATRFSQGLKARIPVLMVTGAKPGPRAVIMACQHGRELNGIAAIERVFAQLDPATLAGEVVFLPVMNPVAARMRVQDYPLEQARYRPTHVAQNMNMNRCWPGGHAANDDTYAQTVPTAVWERYMRHADIALDLHGWSGLSLSLAWAYRKHVAFVQAFGLPWYLVQDEPKHEARHSGMSEACMHAHGIPIVVCELVPQNLICNEAVAHGVRGIRNTLRYAGMLKSKLELPPVQYEFAQDHVETVLRTDAEGLLVSDFRKGDTIKSGQVAARVISLETLETVWAFKAPHDALLFNIGGTPWGEDWLDSHIVYPGQIVGLLKQPSRVVRN